MEKNSRAHEKMCSFVAVSCSNYLIPLAKLHQIKVKACEYGLRACVCVSM